MPTWLYLGMTCVRVVELEFVFELNYSYYLPVCGFAGLTSLWFREVLFLLFGCLWFHGPSLTAVSRGCTFILF